MQRIGLLIFLMMIIQIIPASQVFAQQLPPAQLPLTQLPTTQLQHDFRRAENALRNRTSLLEAKVRTDRVLQAAPNHPATLKLRAEVLMALKDYDGAFKDAQQVVDLMPEDAEALLIMAEAARLLGEDELALDCLKRASILGVDRDAEFHLRLSQSAMLLGDMNLAEAMARVANVKSPEHPAAIYQLSRIFVLVGREEAASLKLVEGLEAGLLDPRYIANDSTLSGVFSQRRLESYLEEINQ